MQTATKNTPGAFAGQTSTPVTSARLFDQISEPGAYVFHNTGHLVRIPEDALQLGRSPVIDLVANEPMVLTKISDNPYIPLTKERILACDSDLPVNF